MNAKPTSSFKQRYAKFLDSEQWHQLRVKCLAEWRHKCRICHARHKLQCHHFRYRPDPTETLLDDLVVLCDACHAMVHRRGDDKLHPTQLAEKYGSRFMHIPTRSNTTKAQRRRARREQRKAEWLKNQKHKQP